MSFFKEWKLIGDCFFDNLKSCAYLGKYYDKLGGNDNKEEALSYYEKSCSKEHVFSCKRVSDFYYYGDFVEANPKKALDYVTLACNYDDVLSCQKAGAMYRVGLGTPKDRKKEKFFFEKACNLNSAHACFTLGRSEFFEAFYTKEEQLKFLDKACSLGDKYGCSNLFHFNYRKYKELSQNIAKLSSNPNNDSHVSNDKDADSDLLNTYENAIKYAKIGCQYKETYMCLMVANLIYQHYTGCLPFASNPEKIEKTTKQGNNGKIVVEAKPKVKVEAKVNITPKTYPKEVLDKLLLADDYALRSLAVLTKFTIDYPQKGNDILEAAINYLSYLKINNKHEIALDFEEKLCNQDLNKACLLIANNYFSGLNGFKEDVNFALKYHNQGCYLSNDESCLFLATYYGSKKNLHIDLTKAEDYLNKACEINHKVNCVLAGDLFKNGELPRNFEKIQKFYFAACQKEEPRGCALLADLYENDEQIIKNKDILNAIRNLHKRSCDLGFASSCLKYVERLEKVNSTNNLEKIKYALRGCRGSDPYACKKAGELYQEMSGDKNNKDALDYLDRACGLGVGKPEDKCEERSLRIYEEK